jgi:hypothetical protein
MTPIGGAEIHFFEVAASNERALLPGAVERILTFQWGNFAALCVRACTDKCLINRFLPADVSAPSAQVFKFVIPPGNPKNHEL